MLLRFDASLTPPHAHGAPSIASSEPSTPSTIIQPEDMEYIEEDLRTLDYVGGLGDFDNVINEPDPEDTNED